MFWVLLVFLSLWFVMSWFPSGKYQKVSIRPSQLSVYYGAPGSGKTTFAAWLARKYINCGYTVYSNVEIDGCLSISKADIGNYAIDNGLLIFDEAGIDYDNRGFKSNFSKDTRALEWWKKHRHEFCECVVLSQGFDDMDKKLRTLATQMYIIRKLGPFIIRRRIRKKPDIDELTKQPIDAYWFVPFGSKWILGRSVWHTFDSFEPMGLPRKDYSVYSVSERDGEALN